MAVGVAGLALAVVTTLVSLPDSPSRPPAWSRPAPQHVHPLLTAAGPVSTGNGPASGTTAGGLARRLGGLLADPALGQAVGAVVAVPGSRVRYEQNGEEPLAPASTMKILTTVGVLSALGPDERFTTSVVRGGGRDEVVLVGGGDPTLTRTVADEGPPDPSQSYADPARLPDLARATAAGLRRDGVRQVRLSVDDTLFVGPTEHPTWPSDYVLGGSVAPVTALSVDAGRVDPDGDAREADPSLAAGALFADMLRSRGIDVSGEVGRAEAPQGARTVAAVHSPRLEEIVETTLAQSNNDMAETLLRQTAVATGRPATFEAGTQATRQALDRLGIDTNGLDALDGSGLSRENQVTASTLVDALTTAASPQHPGLRPVVTGLPVAGFSGTLQYRFAGGPATDVVGLVRAKTGSLTGVSSLAGIAFDGEGEIRVFAVLANDLADPVAAEAQLDRVAAAVAACGCA